jgi:hypothetical protein
MVVESRRQPVAARLPEPGAIRPRSVQWIAGNNFFFSRTSLASKTGSDTHRDSLASFLFQSKIIGFQDRERHTHRDHLLPGQGATHAQRMAQLIVSSCFQDRQRRTHRGWHNS